MVLSQNLPPTVSNYADAQRAEIVDATKAIQRQWRRVGTDFDAGWKLIAPSVIAIMDEAQRRVAAGAAEYIPAVLAATGQLGAQLADPDPSALVGWTGAGMPTGEAMAVATIRAKQSVADGATAFLALQDAGKYLSYVAGTILSDTGRGAEGLTMSAFGTSGWVRVLSPPSCARCVILAGRVYRFSDGFLRHPGCDCRHMPAREAMGSDLTVDPVAYYESLDEPGRLKFAGSQANMRAIESGADMNQIVNAYRRTAGMRFAQVSGIKTDRGLKFTTEGATKRSIAFRAQQTLRKNGPVAARLMPESIYMRAKDPDDAIRLLKLYGWINESGSSSLDRPSVTSGNSHSGAPSRATQAAGGDGAKPPSRAVGAGDAPDEYPATNTGTPVPWTPSTRPRATDADRQHILDGDAFGGGHRFGTARQGKTEFPQAWSDDQIMVSVDETLRTPDRIVHSGDKFQFFKAIDGITVQVAVRADLDPPEIWTAYPLPRE